MTEEVFIYPDEDDDLLNPANDNNTTTETNSAPGPHKAWYRRIPRLRMTHIRYYFLVEILLFVDIFAVAHCALSVATNGPSVEILFGFEAAILLISGLSVMGSYHLHVIDGIMGVFHHFAEGEHHYVPVGGMAEQPEEEEEVESAANENGEQTAVEGNANGEAPAGSAGQAEQQQEGVVGEGHQPTSSSSMAQRKSFAKVLVERLANPWRDRRATLSFAIELQAQAAKFLFYVVFFAIVFTYVSVNLIMHMFVNIVRIDFSQSLSSL